jgi:hypothetical protein
LIIFAIEEYYNFVLVDHNKITNEVRKGLKIDDMALNGAY